MEHALKCIQRSACCCGREGQWGSIFIFRGKLGEKTALICHLVQNSTTYTRLTQRSGDFRCQNNYFGVAHCTLAKSCNYVGGSWSCCGDRDSQPPAYSGKPICGISGGLLMAHPHNGRNLPARLPEGEVVNPWEAEDMGDPSDPEALQHGLGEGGGSRGRGERHSASVSHLRVGSSRDLPISEPSQLLRNRRLL